MSKEEKAAATATNEQEPVFNIEKLYLKDLSLEIPHAPGIFLERDQPRIDLQINTKFSNVQDGIHEVVVTATVTAKLPEKDQVLFLIEAKQAGIFQVRNLPADELDRVLGVVCPSIVYPYLRETISDASTRAGFMPVVLNMINFEAVYLQQKAQDAIAAARTH
jgi:preprotein translocase subunit SecB